MKIKITEFAERHFDPKFGATKILNMSKEDVEKHINNHIIIDTFNSVVSNHLSYGESYNDIIVHEGYAPFCKLVAIKNFTDAKVGSMPITLENYQYLRSGYVARRESELPVFSRWLELPLGKPKADYLMFVLYSKEQIDKEATFEHQKELGKYECKIGGKPIEPVPFDADWGVVAILGQSHPNEEKMKPETMLRNALGVEEGGSGVPLNREAYLESVTFWEKNATVS